MKIESVHRSSLQDKFHCINVPLKNLLSVFSKSCFIGSFLVKNMQTKFIFVYMQSLRNFRPQSLMISTTMYCLLKAYIIKDISNFEWVVNLGDVSMFSISKQYQNKAVNKDKMNAKSKTPLRINMGTKSVYICIMAKNF